MSGTSLTRWATAVAAFMIAHQVAAKAVRDSFFLTVFPATSLPAMVMAAAVVSVAAVPLYSKLLARYSPDRVVPAGFLLSAGVHLLEWSRPSLTPVLAVAVYLHLAALGALLLSGFWSLASETFDPITAKRSYGRIAAAGTLGGIAGGMAAERMAAMLPPSSLLLFLAVLHFCCAGFVLRLADRERHVTPNLDEGLSFAILKAVPHIKPLAAMVLLGTASASILDFLFKSQAAAQFEGANLTRFFAVFYVVTQVLTFVLQATVTDRALARGGVGGTVSALPLSVGIGSVAALLVPALPLFAIARGSEAVMRGSFFRSGYELLFTPMGPGLKRRAKTFLDVACDRAGDALGAGVVQLILALAPIFLVSELLGVVVCMALASLWVARRLNAFYARQVERRLVDRAESLDLGVDVTGWASQPSALATNGLPDAPVAPRPPDMPDIDPTTRTLAVLRSGNRDLVAAMLTGRQTLAAPHVAQVCTLLAWDDVRDAAQQALLRTGERHVGLMLDFLLSPDTDFAVRRRLPRVLGHMSSQRALDGLVRGLDDARFEVRYRCCRAIDQITSRHPSLYVDREQVFAVLGRELSVPQSISSRYSVLDQEDASDPVFSFDSAARANRLVEYLFSLLASVLPREPLKAAYRAVHTDDRLLRGLALDYLNSVLPEALRPSFWTILDVDAKILRHVDPNEAMHELLRSSTSPAVTPSASDAHGQSAPQSPARRQSDPH